MRRLSAFLLALTLAAAGVLSLASCGGGSNADLLPGTTANQINSNLDEVQRLVSEGECIGAEDAVAEVTAQVESLSGVDRRLQAALEEGAAQLSEVVGECQEATSEEAEPSLEPDVEAEELEEAEKKPKKEKPEKEAAEPGEEEPSEDEGPTLPPSANGKGEEKSGGPSSSEGESEESPSGGVGPSVGVEG
jgi:hypothetical protein